MNFSFKYKYDDEYLKKYYKIWLHKISKKRKFEFLFGTLFILSSIVLYLVFNYLWLFLFLMGIGIFTIFDYFVLYNKIWLKKASETKAYGSEIVVNVDDEGIIVITPNSESKIKWEAFIKHIALNECIVLYPHGGNSLIFYNNCYTNKQKDFILNKLISV